MIRNLTSLRFVFVMLVFMNHFLGSILPKTFDFGGECGVSFFFILSGFVLSVGYGQKIEQGLFSTRSFFVRHFRKLYPLHLLTLAAMLALDGRMGQVPKAAQTVANLLLVQTWIPSDRFVFYGNGASWFLCDIFFFYLIFSLLYRACMKAALRKILLGMLVVLCVYFPLVLLLPKEYVNCFLYSHPLLRSIDFVLGILTYRLYQHLTAAGRQTFVDRMSASQVTLAEVTFVFLFVFLAIVYEHCDVALRSVSFFWPFMPFTILFFSLADKAGGRLSRLLHSRLLMRLGGISFEIYMLHLLVLRIMLHFAIRFLPDYTGLTGAWQLLSDGRYLLLLTVILLLTIALAFFVKKFWERIL